MICLLQRLLPHGRVAKAVSFELELTGISIHTCARLMPGDSISFPRNSRSQEGNFGEFVLSSLQPGA